MINKHETHDAVVQFNNVTMTDSLQYADLPLEVFE